MSRIQRAFLRGQTAGPATITMFPQPIGVREYLILRRRAQPPPQASQIPGDALSDLSCTRQAVRGLFRERKRDHLGDWRASDGQGNVLPIIDQVRHRRADRSPRKIDRGELFATGLVNRKQLGTTGGTAGRECVDEQGWRHKGATSTSITTEGRQIELS